MHKKAITIICSLLLITTRCYPVSILNGAKSLVGKITNTFQKGVSSALPDVVVRWEEDDRKTILSDAEQRLLRFSHTAASDLREVAQELGTIADHKLVATSQQIDDLINRLDDILEGRTEHAAKQLTHIMQEFEEIIQHAQNHLDVAIEDINAKFYAIVDHATHDIQDVACTAIRQTGYTVTGAGSIIIGMWMLYQIAFNEHNTGTKAQYVSSASLIGAGFMFIESSESLAHRGITGYARDALTNTKEYIPYLQSESS